MTVRVEHLDTQSGKAYRVHLYAVVRVPIDVPRAMSQLDAIAKAEATVDLHHDFRQGEYAEEVVEALVDENGDDAYRNTRNYVHSEESGQWAEVGSKAGARSDRTGLWAAMVEHESVPGTRVILLAQASEPTDEAILNRFRAQADVSELRIVGLFDLMHAMNVDPGSLAAMQVYGRRFASRAAVDHATQSALPGVTETCVPWGRV